MEARGAEEAVERLLFNSESGPAIEVDLKRAMLGLRREERNGVEEISKVERRACRGTLLRHSGKATGCFILPSLVSCLFNGKLFRLTRDSARPFSDCVATPSRVLDLAARYLRKVFKGFARPDIDGQRSEPIDGSVCSERDMSTGVADC